MRHPGSPNDPLAVKYLTQRTVIRNVFPPPTRRPQEMALFFQKTRSKITAKIRCTTLQLMAQSRHSQGTGSHGKLFPLDGRARGVKRTKLNKLFLLASSHRSL